MNKSDLVTEIAVRANIPTSQADKVFNIALESIKSKLRQTGETVSLSGFGKFMVKERAPRKGRNPVTNQPVDIPAKLSVVFKPSDKLQPVGGD